MKRNVLMVLFLSCCFFSARAGFVPATITSGFNADLIANGVGPSIASSEPFDVPNDYAFISGDFQATGSSSLPTSALPVNGTISSAATGGLTFQLANYSAVNALLLSEDNSSGSIGFTASGIADIYVLTSAANGDVGFTATIHFSDATSQTVNSLTAPDWFNNSGYAISGISRIARSSDNIEASTDNPRMYQVALALDPANYSKTVTGITFDADISGDGTMAVLAVTTNTACTGTPTVGTATSSVPAACVGVAFNLSLSGMVPEGGLSYQWETSADNSNWTPVAAGGDAAVLSTTQSTATYYHCIVTCNASGLSTTSGSVSVGQNLASQCYCVPVYTEGCNSFGTLYNINSVQLTGDNNTSINNTGSGCSGSGYGDYSYTVSPVDVTPYSSYVLNITTQHPYSFPYVTVWIDLNDDGQFDNATENVGTTGDNTATSVALSIPVAPAGQHKMRVRAVWYNYAEVTEPCDEYYNGEAEDYTINMLPVPSCLHPLGIIASNITANGTADVSWDVTAAGATYDWAVDHSPNSAPGSQSTVTNTADTTVMVTGMNGGVSYFHIRSHCSTTDSSNWTVFMISVPSSCDNAQLIPCGGSVTGNNTDQPDADLPAVSCGNGSTNGGHYHGMWYKIVPAVSGEVTVATCNGANWDSYMRVYEGECGNFTSCQGYSDDDCGSQSSVTFTATANTSYYILLAGWSDVAAGPYTLTTTCPQLAPGNDDASGAAQLTLGAGCSGAAYSNAGATSAAGEPYADCNGSAGAHSVWFKFTAPLSGAVKISTDYTAAATLTDSKIGLFEVSDVTDYTTFNEIACDEDNGVTGSGNMSVIYSTGLVGGNTYYVEVDGSASTDEGTFCISVEEINPGMISTAAVNCASIQQPSGSNSAYSGWITLVDGNGNLVASVRNPSGSAPSDFTGSYNVNSGTIRQDATGNYYLDRNYFIHNPAITTPVDVQLFFAPGEMGYLSGISGGTSNPVTMSNLNATKQEGAVCAADYSQGNGPVSVLVQNTNGTVNGVGWIQVSTSSFSNFYLMGGTVPLYIDLKEITAANEGNRNRVDWSTAKEDKGDYFELERSADGHNFSFLATIAAKAMPSDYTYWDNNPVLGVNYYRLKVINVDKKPFYSNVVTATVDHLTAFSLQAYPNPVNNNLILEISGTREADASLIISDATGRVLQTVNVTSGEVKIDMTGFAAGFYLVEYKDALHRQTVKVSKQ